MKPIRPGCLAHASTTRAGRSTAHNQCPIRAGRSRAHHFRSIGTGRPRQRCDGETDKVAIEVDDDDSPLSPASPEVVPLPRWDDLGWTYRLNLLVLRPGRALRYGTAHTNQVMLTIPLTRIGVIMQPHELYGRGTIRHQQTWGSPRDSS